MKSCMSWRPSAVGGLNDGDRVGVQVLEVVQDDGALEDARAVGADEGGTFLSGLIAAKSGDLRSGYATTRRSIASSIPVFSERHSRMRAATPLLLCCMS